MDLQPTERLIECPQCKTILDSTVSHEGKLILNRQYRTFCSRKCKSRKNNPPGYMRRFNIRRLYALTIEQYNELLANQGNCCAICGAHENMGDRPLHVDHDHATNKVRGLLCTPCNRGIGFLRDNSDLLQQAIEYLNEPPFEKWIYHEVKND